MSDRLGTSEKGAVDGIDDGLGANLSSTEKPAVETFDRILAALDTVELEVDVALRVRI